MRRLFVVLGILMPLTAQGSPNVPLDDPRYDELATYHARGLLPLYRGGLAPLTESRIRKLLVAAPLHPREAWLRFDRALLRVTSEQDRFRAYSTDWRPRQIAGGLAVTCEHDEGRPCIGTGTLAELDVSAGVGDYLSGTLRLRANTGTSGFDSDVGADRLYLQSTYGPIAFEVGRDVLVVGPRSRTQLGWGDHAPPLDHVRVSTSEPFELTRDVHANVLYAVAQLRAPQTFDGSLLTISRVQLDLGRTLEIGTQQLLQLGGDGAAPIGGPIDFILEHLRRRDISGSAADSSNRRFGGDVSWLIPELHGLRLYYQVMFEDIRRKYLHDAIRHDADHLFGLELAALGGHALTVEYHQTGVRSQEHSLRLTGMTNAGYVGGSPLGPDAQSLYIGGHVALGCMDLYPWIERAWLHSMKYEIIENGPINHVGPDDATVERRVRGGVRARVPWRHGLSLEVSGLAEYVSNFGVQRGTTRTNGQFLVDVIWRNPR